MRVTSQRGGAARRLAVLLLGAVAGCFHAEFLAYAACDRSEPCAEAGLYGCVIVPEAAGRRGFCAAACDDDAACPDPDTGAAAPRCVRVGEADVCVLSCMSDETCPEGQACTEVEGVAGGAARLCFPETRP